MVVIAAQPGRAGTRICERHYAHLSPGYIAHTIRANLLPLRLHEPDNVPILDREVGR